MTRRNIFGDSGRNDRFLDFMRAERPAVVGQDEYAAFCLYYFDGKTHRDVATEMGVSQDRGRALISKAVVDGSKAFVAGVCPCCKGTGMRSGDPNH